MNGTTTRRKFFSGAAILAAPVAATPGLASDDLAARLAAFEDTNAIRALLQDWAQSVNAGERAAPAADVRALAIDANVTIDIGANGMASASVPCIVETAIPIAGDETLVEMARQQGDGVIRSSERRVLSGMFVKHGGIWQLEHTELTA